ncbi:MAG: hypothetical protein SF069_17090 [Phycisphaerae bacterium]|nr:hypothetical protein [Phycisphaerae bacterium]
MSMKNGSDNRSSETPITDSLFTPALGALDAPAPEDGVVGLDSQPAKTARNKSEIAAVIRLKGACLWINGETPMRTIRIGNGED